jgi:transcriptional regulator with XRE-family HTH domain
MIWNNIQPDTDIRMGSLKTRSALVQLGKDVRYARLRRGITVADLAVRAGSSASSIARLEKGDPGVAVGTLADVLVVLGLIERLGDLIDVRKDELGLALSIEQAPRRGRSFKTRSGSKKVQSNEEHGRQDEVDPDGASF